MLNKPKFMTPSTNMQECTIDVNNDKILFSCIVDGNEAISAWQIIIYKLSDNAEVLNTGKQELSQPFFPIDEKNRNVVFPVDIKPFIDNSSTLSNSSEAYYWTIEFWSIKDKENDSPTTISCEEVFYANSTPGIKLQYGKEKTDDEGVKYIDYIDYPDNEDKIDLDSRKYYFKAVYEGDESTSPLKRYGWRIINIDDNETIIDTITRNQIYGISDNIICSYDGFLNDGNYSVEVLVETQNGTIFISNPYLFSVSYQITFLTNDFKTEVLKKEAAIMLDWSESVVIGGKMLDSNGIPINVEDIPFKQHYPIVDYNNPTPNTSVVIPNEYSVVYNYGSTSSLDISEDAYIVLSTQLIDNSDITLFSAEGTDDDGYEIVRKLSYGEDGLTYSILGKGDVMLTKTYKPTYSPNDYVWYVITMSPILTGNDGEHYISLKVNESVAENGLYPREDLYPSGDLYPSFGTWELKVEGGE